MIKKIVLLFCIHCSIVSAQTDVKALFIGNSYTAYNNLGSIIQSIAETNGNTLVFQTHTPGGSTLMQHVANSTLTNLINSENWDYVILQEQSQMPSFPPNQVATDVYPYAMELCEIIRENYSCTKPVFFTTWGRENGDQGNCEFYAPLCTYEGMQNRLIESYTEMAQTNEALIAPVGNAWANIRANLPSINLYATDGSHPSYEGSYLAASVIYNILYEDLAQEVYYTNLIDSYTADSLNKYANEVTTNTVTSFLTEVEAIASYEIMSDSIIFYNESLNFTETNWLGITQNILDFNDTLIVNLNGYTGDYEINLIASDGCYTDEYIIQIQNLLINDKSSDFKSFPNPSSGFINWKENKMVDQINIYSTDSKLVDVIKLNGETSVDFSFLKDDLYYVQFINSKKTIKTILWHKKN